MCSPKVFGIVGSRHSWMVSFNACSPSQLVEKGLGYCCCLHTWHSHCSVNLYQEFSQDPAIPIHSARPDQVKKALKYVHSAAIDKLDGKELELLIALLPDNNGSLYGMILSLFHLHYSIIITIRLYWFIITEMFRGNSTLMFLHFTFLFFSFLMPVKTVVPDSSCIYSFFLLFFLKISFLNMVSRKKMLSISLVTYISFKFFCGENYSMLALKKQTLHSGDLKRICETDLGLISQCCLTKHVFKINRQYLANVALKINVKVCYY